jgi:hypothetical protein
MNGAQRILIISWPGHPPARTHRKGTRRQNRVMRLPVTQGLNTLTGFGSAEVSFDQDVRVVLL